MSIIATDNKKSFIDIYNKNITRDGAKDLLEWIASTDFFMAPASTVYHANYEGGLCEHSVNVYQRLYNLNSYYNFCSNEETIAAVALLHDLCKIDSYEIQTRNVKNEVTGQWEKTPFYAFKEKFCFGGHGSKSVYLIMKWMQLNNEEATAINCHMGAFDRSPNDWSISNSFEQYQLGIWLHTADCLASWIDETKK